MNADEIQDRTCRVCGRKYQYPIPRSLATRFNCDKCVSLDPEVRAMFQHFNKRITTLQKQVNALKAAAPPKPRDAQKQDA
jgi:hypothetical protein